MNKLEDKITVIVPAYNSEKTIGKCIASLLNQAYQNFEIIVINDGSKDGTLEELAKFNSDKLTVITQKNSGVSIARNNGIKRTYTPYLAFVDADDYVSPDFLTHLMEGYGIQDVDLSISGVNNVGLTNKKNLTYERQVCSSQQLLADILKSDGVKGYLWNKLWKTKIIKKNNLFLKSEISMAEDLLFTVEYLLHTDKIFISNFSDYNYVYYANSLSNRVSLTYNNPKYKEAFSDFLKVNKEIIELIPEDNKIGRINARACAALIASNYIRRIKKEENNIQNKNLVRELRSFGKKYITDVLGRNTILPLKPRISFIITMCCPNLMSMLDKLRSRS
ncbi:glycosyltransferase involved in cell wall biosynthesis [Lactobacillus colini]|uniref:Glycosyltransferase involved in cell wall biosynthesis n=1 Tax=Lactobacillus colini TaxID=1819254 RepID=A0ABS4MEL5_9LACO|nr:glycosyltransferase family 2 protein [Lactobacillus colini]MBP2058106.1 glycosyltransferase involved in cell wall biosynthesis [Lactobacillus colini]